MKKLAQNGFVLVMGLILLTSCHQEQTLQEYYVDHQEKAEFIALDLPASIINLEEHVSKETKETWSTVKKLNILAFKVTDDNKDQYKTELGKIKDILKNDRYNELMRMKHENVQIMINYQGNDETVDEFILLAAEPSKGFALARVLGKHMKPEKMIKMANDFKNLDKDSAALGQLEDLFAEFGIK